LVEYARETNDIVWNLRSALQHFDAVLETYEIVERGGWPLYSFSDPIWGSAFELDDMASWVGAVGWAFAAAGGSPEATTSALVIARTGAVDHWLNPIDWNPSKHLRSGSADEWMRLFDPHCHSNGDAGYIGGGGFLVGPDGRSYPLVAPYVVRDGRTYNADDGVQPGQRSVLDLDGRDPGWTTVYEKIDVERWRDDPNLGEKLLSGIGSMVGGRPNGSSESEVRALVMMPGVAPSIGSVSERASSEPSPPPYMVPKAPDVAPPRQPETAYPGDNAGAAVAGGVPILIEGLAGAFMADQGSHAAYDITLQQNVDGRIRALYKRVYVGFDDEGHPYPESVWVTGPEANDLTMISYAP
jgi:hypothetical protein